MKNLLTFILFISLLGCESKVDGIFYIINSSQDQPKTHLRLIVDNDTIFNQKTEYSNIAPDLQYIENLKLTKGQHEIIFEVVNTGLKHVENVDFDDDKWIYLSYGFKKSADSLKRIELDKKYKGIKNADSIFSEFYYGRKPSLSINIMEYEHLNY